MHALVAHFLLPFEFNWRKTLCRFDALEVKRLRQSEHEHAELRRIAVDLSLDKAMLQDVLSRRFSGLPVGANLSIRCGRLGTSGKGRAQRL
jgi:hypothetical protein